MVIACCTTACLDTATVVHVNRDGSGTLELRKAMNAALLRDFGRPLISGDVNTRSAEPQLVSEADLRRQAERIGGLTFVSSAPITTPNGFTGVMAVFAFRDIKVHRFWLDVKSLNQRAQALYASEGFVEEGRLRESVRAGDGYDSLIVMSMLDREYDARVALGLEG